MSATSYVTLSRQSGLMKEMQIVANNLANLSTAGYRREGVVFSEYIRSEGTAGGSVSMAAARGRVIDLSQGAMTQTGGTFDLAVNGPGFFQVDTPEGTRLTRAGRFLPDGQGNLVTPDGFQVLDAGGAPVFVPTDAASIAIASDGTMSADGQPLAQIGVVAAVNETELRHQAGTLFHAPSGVEPVDAPEVLQGFIEEANIDPVLEIARMIEVQRAYELGQSFLDRESDRKSSVIDTLTR